MEFTLENLIIFDKYAPLVTYIKAKSKKEPSLDKRNFINCWLELRDKGLKISKGNLYNPDKKYPDHAEAQLALDFFNFCYPS